MEGYFCQTLEYFVEEYSSCRIEHSSNVLFTGNWFVERCFYRIMLFYRKRSPTILAHKVSNVKNSVPVKEGSTMVENSQEYKLLYWATRSSVRSFVRTAHSFACSGLLASLAPSAALTRSLARSLRPLPRSWDSE